MIAGKLGKFIAKKNTHHIQVKAFEMAVSSLMEEYDQRDDFRKTVF